MNQTNETKDMKTCVREQCCKCWGHDWIVLDQGETHECIHCDAEITQEEIEAIYDPSE